MAQLPYLKPYDPDFLGNGFRVPLPTHHCRGCLAQSGRVYDYIHFSLVMHKDRRMALYTAHNIDTSQRRSVSRTGWDLDPRLEPSWQTGGGAYKNNPWDRGHLVRRAAVAWGPGSEAKDASDSTFYYTNASPQHQAFNQDDWLDLEDWVLQSAGAITPRLSVFTGPIYTTKDEFNEDTRIPSAFFKIVVLRDPTADGNDLSAVGFLMKQNKTWDPTIENFKPYQVGIAELGKYTGIDFGDIALFDEFEWRQARFRDRSRMAPIPVDRSKKFEFFGNRRRSRGIKAIPVGNALPAIPLPATTRASSSPCGCSDDHGPLDDRVDALSEQVTALREMVELLLEFGPQPNKAERATMGAVRTFYDRIVGGESTAVGEFPECACIGNEVGGQSRWFCSGVLVHPRVILTAAHCAPSIDQVYLGGRSINLIGVPGFGEVVEVERVIVHPDYHPDRVPSHDIAVLILAEEAQTIPVNIAPLADLQTEDSTLLVGFGYDHPSAALGFGTKRKVNVPLTNLEGLSATDIATLESLHGFDGEYEFHAGRKFLGKDSCNGDSGGPTYIRQGNTGPFLLAGLTSRAAFSSEVNCGDGGIYTKVAPYLGWLHQITDGWIGTAGTEGGNDDGGNEGNGDNGGGSDGPGGSPKRGLYISAAQPNPHGTDAGSEWIKISNAGSSDIPLAGYVLTDKAAQGTHPLDGILSAGATVKILLPSSSPVKLSNSKDDILLLHGETIIHKVSYSNPGTGEVLQFEAPVIIDDGGNGGGGNGGSGGGGGNCGDDPSGPALNDADAC